MFTTISPQTLASEDVFADINPACSSAYIDDETLQNPLISIYEKNEIEKEIEWLDLSNAFTTKPEPLDFVIPGLKSGTVGALVSAGGSGKTILTLELAVAVAGGPDLLCLNNISRDWKNKVGRVVFLTGEDPHDVLHHRLHAISSKMTPTERQSVISNLSIAPLMGHCPDLMSSDWRDWIKKYTFGARLVVIDTLRRFHNLDENDGGQMAMLLSHIEMLCKTLGITVLFLHHASKSGALNNSDAQQASRGSSVLTDNPRFQANLSNMTESQAKDFVVQDECRKNFVRWSFPKTNYSEPLPDQWYRRGFGGILEPGHLKTNEKSSSKKPTSTSKQGTRDERPAVSRF